MHSNGTERECRSSVMPQALTVTTLLHNLLTYETQTRTAAPHKGPQGSFEIGFILNIHFILMLLFSKHAVAHRLPHRSC